MRDASRNLPHAAAFNWRGNHLWNIERWEIGSGSVGKRHALLKSLFGNYPRPVHVCHRWRRYIHRLMRPSTRNGWPLKANHFELDRLAIPTRKIGGVTPGFRSGRQHRSIFRNGCWRQTLSLQLSDYGTVPELPYDFAVFRKRRCSTNRQQFRFFHLQPGAVVT